MRLLMCAPEHFDVTYEINEWMRIANGPDAEKSRRQWAALYNILREEVGADVHLIEPQPGLPGHGLYGQCRADQRQFIRAVTLPAHRAAGRSGVLHPVDAGERLSIEAADRGSRGVV